MVRSSFQNVGSAVSRTNSTHKMRRHINANSKGTLRRVRQIDGGTTLCHEAFYLTCELIVRRLAK